MTDSESRMLAALNARRAQLGEWDRDFLDGLTARDNSRPLTEWQSSQLRVCYRQIGPGPAPAAEAMT